MAPAAYTEPSLMTSVIRRPPPSTMANVAYTEATKKQPNVI